MTMRLYDRSRVTTDWKCKRRRYYNYEHNGTGIVSWESIYELFFGNVFHDATATIANFHLRGDEVPIDAIAEAGFQQVHGTLTDQLHNDEYALEQGYLISGLIRGFYRSMWPQILKLYPEIIAVEQEVLGEDGFMVKPDLIAQTNEGTLVYIEYKTTSSINEKWQTSWETNPQLHSYMKTIKDKLGLDIGAAIVIGAYKGYVSSGRQTSPFCYAYHRPANPPFQSREISYKWKAGMKKLPVWEMDGDTSPEAWFDEMPDEVLDAQFVMVPPVYPNDTIADAFFRQARVREAEIDQANNFLKFYDDPEMVQGIMDAFFPQNFEACRPGWGSSCPYSYICIDGMSPDEPVWQPRTPHHQPEADAWSKDLGLDKPGSGVVDS